MITHPHHLLSPLEAEAEFGEKYFYRQRIYRMAEKGTIATFKKGDDTVFLGSHILKAFLGELESKIQEKFPELKFDNLRIFYDLVQGHRIVVDGLYGSNVSVDTTKETEEDLLKKIASILEWLQQKAISELNIHTEEDVTMNDQSANEVINTSLPEILPEEIYWRKVDVGSIEGIEIKSGILISLPSIAQFIGVRTDNFITWVLNTNFKDKILSAHPKHLYGTGISVPWKKGVETGYTSLLPFEYVPEVIVAFKQGSTKPKYPEKAEMLYELSKRTLMAVGLAISGNTSAAANELAAVGQSLGLSAADQIIGIFKQYESRDYQIQTSKEFASKVKKMGQDYAEITGKLTLGITNRTAGQWLLFGASRQLPSKLRTSGREVMRQLQPEDSVGMVFGEKHYIKDPNLPEAVETGKKGKELYHRLKKVGLLDEPNK